MPIFTLQGLQSEEKRLTELVSFKKQKITDLSNDLRAIQLQLENKASMSMSGYDEYEDWRKKARHALSGKAIDRSNLESQVKVLRNELIEIRRRIRKELPIEDDPVLHDNVVEGSLAHVFQCYRLLRFIQRRGYKFTDKEFAIIGSAQRFLRLHLGSDFEQSDATE